VRHSDTAARLGGDEFAILVEGFESRASVVDLAQRISSALRRPISIGSQALAITVSVGITFASAGASSEELLSNADIAMYSAKSHGKNRVEIFEDHMHEAIVARLELESDLRDAVERGEFVAHYQPIVDLVTRHIAGFEALARWQHPSRGLLAPKEFIEFAEDIGVIGAIDRLILTEACSQVRSWELEGLVAPETIVSANLSAREVMDPALGRMVEDSLLTSGFAPEHLVLEITESAVMRDVEAASRHLRGLTDLGLRVAIDDFGTGYSSFSHLQRLPVSILKVDRTFLADAHGETLPRLTAAILQLALVLGLTPIAEGVESEPHAEHLVALGCRLAQGFHLGRPLDADATGEMLRARRD
jgi:predicted signal transduction protein with EAL and GGDEF domain